MATSPKGPLLVNGALAAVLIVVAAIGWRATTAGSTVKAAPRTTTVQRGAVQSTVTASGNVLASSTLNLAFKNGGTLTAMYVKQGDQVQTGQPLAKIDDTDAKAALATAQANLASAQDKLAETTAGLTPAQVAQNRVAEAAAQQQVDTAAQNLDNARRNAAVNVSGYQNALNRAQDQLNRDTGACATPTSAASGGAPAQSCSDKLATDQTSLADAAQSDTAGVNKDQEAIASAQAGLASAQTSQRSTLAADVVKAEVMPSAVASAQAGLQQAQTAVDSDQRAVDQTTLVAPVAGTVSSVNASVGQTVGGGGAGSSSSTSTGTGSTGSTGSPSTAGASTTTSPNAGSSSSSASGSSSAFLTLTDLSTFQVKAGFAEADAVKLGVGQPATVSLDALPTQQIAGRVVEVDTTSTVSSNVVTYDALIELVEPPGGTKPGMTANVSVITGLRPNVLRLPTADIRTTAGASTVTVMNGTQQVTRPVTIGLKGDDATEIVSGVNQGDTVVAPTIPVSGTTGGGTGGGAGAGAGRFGGGGGGLGGPIGR